MPDEEKIKEVNYEELKLPVEDEVQEVDYSTLVLPEEEKKKEEEPEESVSAGPYTLPPEIGEPIAFPWTQEWAKKKETFVSKPEPLIELGTQPEIEPFVPPEDFNVEFEEQRLQDSIQKAEVIEEHFANLSKTTGQPVERLKEAANIIRMDSLAFDGLKFMVPGADVDYTMKPEAHYTSALARGIYDGVAQTFRSLAGAHKMVQEFFDLPDKTNPFRDFSEIFMESKEYYTQAPDDALGDMLYGLGAIAPDIFLSHYVIPTRTISFLSRLTGGAIKQVPKFASYLGLKEGFGAYEETGSFLDGVKGYLEGMKTGLFYEALGITGKTAGDWAAKFAAEKIPKIAIGEALNIGIGVDYGLTSLLFGAVGMVESGVYDLRTFLSGTMVGFALKGRDAVARIERGATRKAFSSYFTSTPALELEAMTYPKFNKELRVEAIEARRLADKTEGEERSQYLQKAAKLENIIGIRATSAFIDYSPETIIKAIEADKTLTPGEIEYYTQKVNDTFLNNNADLQTVRPQLQEIRSLKGKIDVIDSNKKISEEEKAVARKPYEERIQELTKDVEEKVRVRIEERAMGEKYQVGITVATEKVKKIKTQLDKAQKLWDEGKTKEADAIYKKILDDAQKQLEGLFKDVSEITTSVQQTKGAWFKEIEPTFEFRITDAGDNFDKIISRVASMGEQWKQDNVHISFVEPSLPKGRRYGREVGERDGSVYEMDFEFVFKEKITDEQFNEIIKIVDEVDLPGFTLRADRNSINLYNITHFENYGKFREKLKRFAGELNDRGIGTDAYQGVRRLWNIGEKENGATRTYEDIRSQFPQTKEEIASLKAEKEPTTKEPVVKPTEKPVTKPTEVKAVGTKEGSTLISKYNPPPAPKNKKNEYGVITSGKIHIYHSTSPENIKGIQKKGILVSRAKAEKTKTGETIPWTFGKVGSVWNKNKPYVVIEMDVNDPRIDAIDRRNIKDGSEIKIHGDIKPGEIVYTSIGGLERNIRFTIETTERDANRLIDEGNIQGAIDAYSLKGWDKEFVDQLPKDVKDYFDKRIAELKSESYAERTGKGPKEMGQEERGETEYREVEEDGLRGAPEQQQLETGPEPKDRVIAKAGFSVFGIDLDHKSAVNLWKKYMAPAQGMPKPMHKSWIRSQGRLRSHLAQAHFNVVDFNRALGKVYGRNAAGIPKVSEAEAVKINNALGSLGKTKVERTEALVDIPEPLHKPLIKMRDHLDALSRELMRTGMVEGDLLKAFKKNLGVYLTRTYKVHTDKKWVWKNIPEEIKNRAISWMVKEYPKKSMSEIEGMLRAYLYNQDGPMKAIQSGKMGVKDLGVLMHKEDIPVELRDLLGEYQDAKYNYSTSVAKMADLLERHKFMEEAKKEGKGKYFFAEPKPEGNFIAEIAPKGDYRYYPLTYIVGYEKGETGERVAIRKSYYTTPEIAEAFHAFNKASSLPGYLRAYMKGNVLVKYGKTILSPVTHARNYYANYMFHVANGRIFVKPSGAFATAHKTMIQDMADMSNKEFRTYLKRLIELNVIGESTRAGEVHDILKDAEYLQDFVRRGDNLFKIAGKKTKKFLEKAYQVEDDIHKIISYEVERARYKPIIEKRNPKASPEEIMRLTEEKAAEITRNTMPTYSMVPKLVRSLRRFPLVGTFVSFPAEVLRVSYNTIELGVQELKSKDTWKIGATRLGGMLFAATSTAAASAAASYLLGGMDAQDRKDMRRFTAYWSQNSDLMTIANKGNGNFVYIDIGFSDPQSYVKKAVMAAILGEDFKDAFLQGLAQMAEPFLSEELVAEKLLDLQRNRRKNTDIPIYSEGGGDFGEAAWKYFWEGVQPGAVYTGKRIRKSLYKDPALRKGLTIGNELRNLFLGLRTNPLDVGRAMQFKLDNAAVEINDAYYMYKKKLNKAGVKDKERQRALENADRKLEKVIMELHEDYKAALRLGVPREKLVEIVVLRTKSGPYQASPAVIDGILTGRYRGLDPATGILR